MPTTTTTSSTNTAFQPFFEELFIEAFGAAGQVSTDPFPGELLAPPDPAQLAALDLQITQAAQLEGIGNPFLALADFTAKGGFLDPSTNPFLQPLIEAATRPITDKFLQETLPQLSSAAIAQGAFGGNREGVTAAVLAGDVHQNLLDAASSIVGQNYFAERNFQQNAGQIALTGVTLNQFAPELLAQVGDIRRQFGQQVIESDIAAFNNAQQAPFAAVEPLANILFGGSVGSNTTTTQSVPGQGTSIQDILGIGGFALGAANTLFGPQGFDPGGAGTLGALGSLGGTVADIFGGIFGGGGNEDPGAFGTISL